MSLKPIMDYAKSRLWILLTLILGTIVLTGLVLLFFPSQELTETGLPQPTPYVYSGSPIEAEDAATKELWVTVTELKDVGGRWEGETGRLSITTTDGIYPWRIDYEPTAGGKRPIRCGFYVELTDDWRPAYCTGWDKKPEEGAYAVRLVLQTMEHDPAAIRVQIGNTIEVYLNRRYDGTLR